MNAMTQCRLFGVRLSAATKHAIAFNERMGLRFGIDFGWKNADAVARERFGYWSRRRRRTPYAINGAGK